MVEAPNNGGRVKKGDPLADRILDRVAEYRRLDKPYPKHPVNDYYAVPFVWLNRIPYHAETLDVLTLTPEGRKRPIVLPDHFIITGDEQLPGENVKQYQKYLTYRDLGPERSLNAAAIAWGKKSFKTNTNGYAANDRYVAQLAFRFRWRERCAAWDARREIEARRHEQAILQEQIAEEIDRRKTYLSNEWWVVELAFRRLAEMLELPVVETESETVSEDGKTIITIWRPAKWTYASMAQMIGEVAKLGRLHTGLSTSNAAQKIDIQANVSGSAQTPMSAEDEEMHAFAAARAEEAYFAALDEWREMQAKERQPERLRIESLSVAD